MKKNSTIKIEENYLKEKKAQYTEEWNKHIKKYLEKGFIPNELFVMLRECMRKQNEIDSQILKKNTGISYE